METAIFLPATATIFLPSTSYMFLLAILNILVQWGPVTDKFRCIGSIVVGLVVTYGSHLIDYLFKDFFICIAIGGTLSEFYEIDQLLTAAGIGLCVWLARLFHNF